jgi:hypothetical protein
MMHWFLIGVEALAPTQTGTRTYYCARARLLGEALDVVLRAAGRTARGRHTAAPVCAEIVEELPDGCTELIRRKLYLAPVTDADESGFVPPHGVLPAVHQPPTAPTTLEEGFAVLDGPEDGFTVHAVVDRTRFEPVWQRVAAIFPQVDAIIVRVLNHYDNHLEVTEAGLRDNVLQTWVRDSALSPTQFAPLFHSLETDILHNGHLDFAIHSTPTDATLWLTEHKTIRLVATNPAFRDRVAECLAADVPERESAFSFENNGVTHMHYRPHGSRNPKALARWLRSAGWTRTES